MANQFLRTELLLGKDRMRLLKKGRVLVMGLGAVGSYAIEGLARAGIGALGLVDYDVIDETNINRQLYAMHSTLGRAKVEVARDRILDINPDCEIQTFQVFAHGDSLDTILAFKPQLVIDAIDSLNPKVNVLRALHERRTPVISSMGAALRTDLTRIHFGDLFSARGCPLARIVRRRLRGLGITQGIPCVYSSEPVSTKAWEMPEEPSGIERGRTRNILGSMSTVTGIFGLTIAHQAVEMLIGGFDGRGR